MKTLPASKSNQWQTERAAKLQRACEQIRRAIASGKPVGKTIRRVARRLNGRPYRCNPSRRLKLHPVTLRRIWDAWRRGGEVPAVFKLNFYRQPSALTAAVLVRFTDFVCASHHRSMRAAWQRFCARPGAFKASDRREKKVRKVTYDMVCHNFGAANFYRLQGALKAMHAAQINLAKERLDISASIRNRLPDRLLRRRVKQGITFEI
jgi:hypothetical protein